MAEYKASEEGEKMERSQCDGCEFAEILKFDNFPLAVDVCCHKSLYGGIGIWIARLDECPKQKEENDVRIDSQEKGMQSSI